MTHRRTDLHFSISMLGICLVASALLPISIGCEKPVPAGATLDVSQDTPQVANDAAPAENAPTQSADSDGQQATPNESVAADATPDDKADPFAIADDATTKDLVALIIELMNTRPEGETREEMVVNYVKIQRAVGEAASRVLADENAKEEAAMALQVKIRSMQALEQLADEDISDEKKELVKLYQDDPREGIAEMIAYLDLSSRFDELFADDADIKKATAALIEQIEKDDLSNPLITQMFEQYAQSLEYRDAYAEAADVYAKLQDKWSKSDDPRLKMSAEQFESVIRRLALFGKKVEVAGQLLDGTDVDWDAYRGKYVLVDFWATWCGPCVAELPNVLENYEKYHDKGFDVLAISLDGGREATAESIAATRQSVANFMESQKLPWKTLYSTDPEATGWKHPMATLLGISGIPFAMLVDPEGKVISFNARAENLGELLKEHLGPDAPEEKSTTKTEAPVDETEEKPAGETEEQPAVETEEKPESETEEKPAGETDEQPAAETEEKPAS